jgi:MoxR-like ATPase
MSSNPIPLTPTSPAAPPLLSLRTQIERVFVGKPEIVQLSVVTLLAGGHLLIEDVPGVGKTTLALSLAKSIGCSFQRIQFTSDLLPSDILGVSLLNPKSQEFEFRPGGIFNQVVLADELNRSTPRTQSALLEAMNERQVSMDNRTHTLPSPFFVIATQNPHEHHGTFPLPESQLDRFMMRLSIGYPDPAYERKILAMDLEHDGLRHLQACLTPGELLGWMNRVHQVTVSPVVDQYILALVQATRTAERVDVGVSPRGALALRKASQAFALLQGRDHVTPDDVKGLTVPVLAHRLIFSADQVTDLRAQAENVIQAIVQKTAVPL